MDDDGGTQNNSNNNFAESARRTNSKETANSLRKHSPVVYQYFGRSRSRGMDDAPVNFILLGPNVDHWKTVGQTLASRGFNVMACERMAEKKTKSRRRGGEPDYEDAPDLVLEILGECHKKVLLLLIGGLNA